MSKPWILVTNDDGVRAPELGVLVKAMAPLGEVWVFAPDREQSAVGHGVSLRRPLRVLEVEEKWFMVDGTPADCVMLAVRGLLERRPGLVVSGINAGANLGDDVTYSGTVAGAYEGMLLGIPSFAISNVNPSPKHLTSSAQFAAKLAQYVLSNGLPQDTMLNVNVPDLPYEQIGGVKLTRMGRRNYRDEIVTRSDPRGGTYYWIGGNEPAHVAGSGTDFDAIGNDMISVTPLGRDITNYDALDALGMKGLVL